ncbi:hypothetical protein BXZ70DRAFT_465945 [Cristinia sonorae]|uniref:FAD/NAD(P)-binding domain-containing protein n=1 Tax=Cristinia sonorae TaxID=1940300 RepID=A0A8K0XM05_9AGAR|nr:hypothetical protein BXZ70DRAFT_465945 [Cristinia sonorae]
MASTEYLPTTANIHASIAPDTDVAAVAKAWLSSFAHAVQAKDTALILQAIHPDGWWRDLFALTWDLRTFQGQAKIKQFVEDRIVGQDEEVGLKINEGILEAALMKMYDDLQFIRVQFALETRVAGGRGVAFIVPTPNDGWKAFILATHLDSIKDHPERIGPLRSFAPNHGKWEDARRREQAFEDPQKQPEVIIVGAGHSALGLAARLGTLGVRVLIVDKNERVGDNWRNRYEALCLHDTVWSNHLPYLPFPPNWPVYIPAKKIANWLEHYAEVMELNVWMSTLVTKATRDEKSGKWSVTVKNTKSGDERVVTSDHVVFALGFGGQAKVPDIPDRDTFQGQVLHSTEHRSAKDHLGKKVVIVGACTSAHDIAADYAEHGVDVTLFQRSSTHIMSTKEGMPRLLAPLFWEGGPPTDIADRIANTIPVRFSKLLGTRRTKAIAEADKEILDGLHSVGYKTNDGEGGGLFWLAMKRGGGYYLDVGACQMIIDGKIKIKNGTQIERFTPSGLKFEDGSEINADVILFATGFGDQRDAIRPIVGDAVADKMPKIWGLNDEGELNGVWRELGTDGLWYMIGNFAWARFFSKHVALQIKAKQIGVFGTRYSAAPVM